MTFKGIGKRELHLLKKTRNRQSNPQFFIESKLKYALLKFGVYTTKFVEMNAFLATGKISTAIQGHWYYLLHAQILSSPELNSYL